MDTTPEPLLHDLGRKLLMSEVATLFEVEVTTVSENGVTIIQFDLRQLDFQRELGTTSPICWRQDVYHVDIHEPMVQTKIRRR